MLGFLSMFMLSAVHSAELPDPDGEPADMSKKVKVFIVMGQSNTLEMGKVAGGEGSLEHAVKEEGLYPFLIDDAGNWTVRKDVRQVHVMQRRGNMSVGRNDFLTVKGGKIGIDLGIGHQLGTHFEEPVMVLRSSIGNRSLGWDLLPPGSERYEFEDPKDGKTYVYPGYKDEVRHSRWEKGNVPEPPKHGWYAGKQYDDDVANAKKILENLSEYYPEATGYEVVGFLWWQGDKDRYNAGHAYHYGKHLGTLVKALRKDFNAPDAKFVCATLGQTDKDNATGNEKMILEGMMAVGQAEGEYSGFKGDVATVYTHPLSMGSSSNAHYSGNAKTYMNVGLAMGEAMVELLD
ncbi:MAG TPA: sialate O-acetylesterase [Opitutales bacterium]|nr:sialate O-acetylesterase [Opitutales bacterium]